MINRFLFSFMFLTPMLAMAQPDAFDRVMGCNSHMAKTLDPDRQRVLAIAEQLHSQYILLEENLGPKFLRINLGSSLDELNLRLSNYAAAAFNPDPAIRIADTREALDNLGRSLNDSLNTAQRKLIDTVPLEPAGLAQTQRMQQLQGSQLNHIPYGYGNPFRPRDPAPTGR